MMLTHRLPSLDPDACWHFVQTTMSNLGYTVKHHIPLSEHILGT